MRRIYLIFKQSTTIFVRKDILGRDVPALTYSTLKALIPVLALVYVLGSALGCGKMLESWLRTTLESQPTVADYLVGFVHNYLENTRSQYILIVGAALMIYTLYLMVRKVEKTFNSIWGTEMRKVKSTLWSYPVIFFFCVLMILVAYCLNVLAIIVAHKVLDPEYIGTFRPIVIQLTTIVPMFAFLVFVYSFVPNAKVRIRYTLWPALLASIFMAFLQYFYIKAQFALASYNVIYGSLAALPLFILWMQFLWTFCTYGGTLAYANQQLSEAEKAPASDVVPEDVQQVL